MNNEKKADSGGIDSAGICLTGNRVPDTVHCFHRSQSAFDPHSIVWIYERKKEGMFVGFFCGLLIDIFYGSMIGFYALIYMYIGFGNGFLYKIFFDEDVKVPMVLVAGSDIAYGVLVYGLQFMLRGRLDFFSYLQHIILPEMVYTVLLTAVLYRPLYRLNRWLTENEWEGPKLP